MIRFLKWFWPPLLMFAAVAGILFSAWSAVNRDVPLDLSHWRDAATPNAAKHLTHKARIKDLNTETLARSQAKAQALQQQYGMGELTIPSVNIDLTIYSVVTNHTLATGVSRYFPDRPMGQGNNVYAAHNLDGAGVLLSRIGELKKGALISQTDFKHVYQYHVIYNRVVKMTEIAVLNQTDESRITLIRCEGPYHSRYRRVVIGRLSKVTPYQTTGAKADARLAHAQQHTATLFHWQAVKWPIGLILLLFVGLLAISCRGYYRETLAQRR